jgi:hypothetical protein
MAKMTAEELRIQAQLDRSARLGEIKLLYNCNTYNESRLFTQHERYCRSNQSGC